MADETKTKTKPAVTATEITNAGIKKLSQSIAREKAKAKEHAGIAGDHLKKAVQKHGLEKKGLTFVLGLEKMEVTKRQGALRGVIEYAHKLGMFDDVDAFDDMAERFKSISDEITARRHNQDGSEKADNVVGIADAGKDTAAAG